MIADAINGFFELGGAFTLAWNLRAILRDKKIRGISIIPMTFYALWGYWNLYFYPSLGQWLSFAGGIGVVLANTTWVFLAWKYRNN